MNALITVGVILVIALIVTLIIVRVTRNPATESPKRSELTRARVRAATADRAMHDIEGVLDRAAKNFPGGLPAYQAYQQQQQAINEAIKSGRVKVLPIPAGSPVIVDPEGN